MFWTVQERVFQESSDLPKRVVRTTTTLVVRSWLCFEISSDGYRADYPFCFLRERLRTTFTEITKTIPWQIIPFRNFLQNQLPCCAAHTLCVCSGAVERHGRKSNDTTTREKSHSDKTKGPVGGTQTSTHTHAHQRTGETRYDTVISFLPIIRLSGQPCLGALHLVCYLDSRS